MTEAHLHLLSYCHNLSCLWIVWSHKALLLGSLSFPGRTWNFLAFSCFSCYVKAWFFPPKGGCSLGGRDWRLMTWSRSGLYTVAEKQLFWPSFCSPVGSSSSVLFISSTASAVTQTQWVIKLENSGGRRHVFVSLLKRLSQWEWMTDTAAWRREFSESVPAVVFPRFLHNGPHTIKNTYRIIYTGCYAISYITPSQGIKFKKAVCW